MAAVSPSRVVAISNCAEAVPLAVHCENYLRENQFAPRNTLRSKMVDLRHYMTFLSSLLEQPYERIMHYDATQSAIRAFAEHRLQVESTASASRRLATVKHLHRWVAEKFGAVDTARALRLPAVVVKDFRGLSAAHRVRLLRDIETTTPRNRFIIQLLYSTGMRRSEAARITLGQISDDWRFYTNVLGKGRRVRNIPITPSHRRDLLRYLAWRQVAPTLPDFPLIIKYSGAQQRPESWAISDEVIKRVCMKFGINAHALRHEFARAFLANRSKVVGAAQAYNETRLVLGHSDIKTTMIYTIPGQHDLYDAMEDFDYAKSY